MIRGRRRRKKRRRKKTSEEEEEADEKAKRMEKSMETRKTIIRASSVKNGKKKRTRWKG